MLKPRLLLALCTLLAALSAQARDTEYKLPIDDVLNGSEKAKFADAKFYFGTRETPAVDQKLGEFVTNRKTNSFVKGDTEACKWAMASALIQLAKRAQELGGDAVVNVRSFYAKNEFSSETEYECHAGAMIAGVALKGEIVKLK